MNTHLNVNATAVADLTGEAFRAASNRLADRRTWTHLVDSASQDQALLEALILGGLALHRTPEHPLGVVEAFRAEVNLLHLRLESAKAVEALLDLLPYAEKRGTKRGIPGLRASMIGKQLELTASFGDKARIRWNAEDPKVHIHLQGDEPLAAVLQKRYERVVHERCTPHWVPGGAVAPPRRRLPLARDVIAQHRASAQMASALLRRPRMWTALVGHDGLTMSSAISEHGLDWALVRTVARGAALHDERLVELLQDTIAGPDLQLLDHTCEPKTCTLRFVGFDRRGDGWRGILTIRTEHGDSVVGRPGRALAVLGEERPPSRPARRAGEGSRPEPTRCFVLTSGPSSPEALEGVTAAAAFRLVTAWAAEGHVSAVLTISDADFSFDWYATRSGAWPKASVPGPAGHVMRWNRLRLTPSNGEAWRVSLTPRDGMFAVVENEAIDAALDAARMRCSRILVLDERQSAWAGGLTNKGIDGVIFAFGASEYPRTAAPPAWRRAFDGDGRRPLTPKDSAALWRECHLGQSDLSRLPLAGLVALPKRNEQMLSDAFTEQVEDHLSRYGTPVLGWLPPVAGEARLLHSDATKTALDSMSQQDRAAEIAAASAIGGKLW
ncbi:hypothetical protein OG571_46370 (plasmid) [Streptomyces sp. NBC_01369]|uniref:hypothetical protein n=1 Tax=Streptomyces sp. NBC_01369 TaxID=2903842 RepID=UPI002F90C784